MTTFLNILNSQSGIHYIHSNPSFLIDYSIIISHPPFLMVSLFLLILYLLLLLTSSQLFLFLSLSFILVPSISILLNLSLYHLLIIQQTLIIHLSSLFSILSSTLIIHLSSLIHPSYLSTLIIHLSTLIIHPPSPSTWSIITRLIIYFDIFWTIMIDWLQPTPTTTDHLHKPNTIDNLY